ncbi:MAG: AI-2E family transporter [Pseudomonadota bacterium]|nr:AI-2E family transporter [Pseudomonadota bacterium]
MKPSPYQWAGLIALGVLAVTAYKMPTILVDIIFLSFLAYLVTPIVRGLCSGIPIGGFTVPVANVKVPRLFQLRMSKKLSIPLLTILMPLLLMVGLGAYLVTVVGKLESLFAGLGGFSEDTLRPLINGWMLSVQEYVKGTPLERIDINGVTNWLVNVPAWIGDMLVGNLKNVLGIAPTVVHWGVFLIMLWIATTEWEKDVSPFIVEFVHLVTPDSWEGPVDRTFASIDNSLKNLLVGWAKIGLTLAAIIMVVLLIAGFSVTMAIFLGLVAGFLSVVPFIGSWIALSVSLVVTFATFLNESLYPYIVVLVGVGAVNFVLESKILTPKYVGDSLRVWKIGVILAVIAGGKLFGGIGFVAALPMLAVIKAFAVEGILQIYFYKRKHGHKRGSDFFKPLIDRHHDAHRVLKRKMWQNQQQAAEEKQTSPAKA